MKKILFTAFFLLICSLSFAEDTFLPFIKDLLEGKIECTEEVFLEHGFVDISERGEYDYLTTWENHYVNIYIFNSEENIVQIIIDQNQSLYDVRRDVVGERNTPTPDFHAYLSMWKKISSYFFSNSKLISSENHTYQFEKFRVITDNDYCIFILDNFPANQ